MVKSLRQVTDEDIDLLLGISGLAKDLDMEFIEVSDLLKLIDGKGGADEA